MPEPRKNYIIKPLGDMYMADVTQDDIKMALVPASKKSTSVFRSVNMLMKCIFFSAEDNHIIDENPAKKISSKGGVQEKGKEALTDEQVQKLLDAINGLPPYVFVMIGLYAGLRREKIKHTVKPVLGERAAHNTSVVYSLDFQVTPHQLRHTYITNLIYAGVDPKTVQYLAGHENSKITMDIYAKVKYNKPSELVAVVNGVFKQSQQAVNE